MKQAQLHTGEVLKFPANTHDSVIDATVKRHLGVEPPQEAPAGPPMEQVVVESVRLLVGEIRQLREAVAGLRPVLEAGVSSSRGVVGAVAHLATYLDRPEPQAPVLSLDGLNATIDDAMQRVLTVLTAPKRLVMEHGKPVGVEIAHDG